MRYIKVKWNHSNPQMPVTLYSEIDDAGWELRKVEIFRDGSVGYASAAESRGDTGLGLVPIPPILEIAKDPAFEPSEITAKEFEEVWDQVKLQSGGRK